jgi:hypothetical protein
MGKQQVSSSKVHHPLELWVDPSHGHPYSSRCTIHSLKTLMQDMNPVNHWDFVKSHAKNPNTPCPTNRTLHDSSPCDFLPHSISGSCCSSRDSDEGIECHEKTIHHDLSHHGKEIHFFTSSSVVSFEF